MINVAIKKCVEPNCLVIPLFNYAGRKKGEYCLKHKKPEMIDVRHKKC